MASVASFLSELTVSELRELAGGLGVPAAKKASKAVLVDRLAGPTRADLTAAMAAIPRASSIRRALDACGYELVSGRAADLRAEAVEALGWGIPIFAYAYPAISRVVATAFLEAADPAELTLSADALMDAYGEEVGEPIAWTLSEWETALAIVEVALWALDDAPLRLPERGTSVTVDGRGTAEALERELQGVAVADWLASPDYPGLPGWGP